MEKEKLFQLLYDYVKYVGSTSNHIGFATFLTDVLNYTENDSNEIIKKLDEIFDE